MLPKMCIYQVPTSISAAYEFGVNAAELMAKQASVVRL